VPLLAAVPLQVWAVSVLGRTRPAQSEEQLRGDLLLAISISAPNLPLARRVQLTLSSCIY